MSQKKYSMETDLHMKLAHEICMPYYDLLGINPAEYRYIKISNFLLSMQSYNCLKEANINTLEDFLKLSDEKLMNLKNLGQENFKEIKHRILEQNDFSNVEPVLQKDIIRPYYKQIGVDPAEYRHINISDFPLTVRSHNCLKEANINTLEDFLKLSDEKLIRLRNLGQKSFTEIKYKILEQNDFSNVEPVLQKDIIRSYYKQIGVDPAEYRHINISDFPLTVRSHNCLKEANINTLEDFLKLSDEKLLRLRNLGQKSFSEIKYKILEQNDFMNAEFIFARPYYKQMGVNPKKYNQIKISDFLLSMNSYNCLKKANIDTLGDLLQLSDNELRSIKNLSLKSFNEIKKQLLRQENFNRELTIQQSVENPVESLGQVNKYYASKDKTRIYKDFRNISPAVFVLAMNSDCKITDLLWESKYDDFVALCLGNDITKAGALLFVPFRNDQLVNLFHYKRLSEIINKVKDWLEGLSLNRNKEEYSTDAILSFFWRN